MTIPQPHAIYETSNGQSRTSGPTLAGGSYATGIIGSGGLAETEASSATSPGITVNGNLSVGMWIWINNDLRNLDATIYSCKLDDGAKALGFTIESTADNEFRLSVRAGEGTILLTATDAIANGWRYVSFAKGTTTQMYVDGVVFGASGSVTSSTTVAANTSYFASDEWAGTIADQFAYWDSELTAGNFLEVVNSGAGLAWANPWSAGGGAGARAFHLFRMMQGE